MPFLTLAYPKLSPNYIFGAQVFFGSLQKPSNQPRRDSTPDQHLPIDRLRSALPRRYFSVRQRRQGAPGRDAGCPHTSQALPRAQEGAPDNRRRDSPGTNRVVYLAKFPFFRSRSFIGLPLKEGAVTLRPQYDNSHFVRESHRGRAPLRVVVVRGRGDRFFPISGVVNDQLGGYGGNYPAHPFT